MRILLAAGLIRDYEFLSAYSYQDYLRLLERKGTVYKELDRFDRADGSVVVRILTQYNSTDLIEL